MTPASRCDVLGRHVELARLARSRRSVGSSHQGWFGKPPAPARGKSQPIACSSLNKAWQAASETNGPRSTLDKKALPKHFYNPKPRNPQRTGFKGQRRVFTPDLVRFPVNFLFRSSANCGKTFPFWNNEDIYLYIETDNYRQSIAENSRWLHSSWKERKKERKEKHIYIYIYVICSVYIQLYSYTRLCILLVITPVPSKTVPFSLPSPSLSQEANPLPRGTIEAAFVSAGLQVRLMAWRTG